MTYELYYHRIHQGRGEFVRLALEEAGADYVEMAATVDPKDSRAFIQSAINDPSLVTPPFAPPFLRAGDLLISHVANILLYIGTHHGLAPDDEGGRYWMHSLQLTMTDFVKEIHDTHHPIANMLYYEDQRTEAMRRCEDFRASRAPKFLGYFERVLKRNPSGQTWLVGDRLTCADITLFQIVAGLRYGFPKLMSSLEPGIPGVMAVHDRVESRPRIAAYLASPRRQPFDDIGVFRHYPELDGPAGSDPWV
ncbi:MAG: glutathione S-transferase [Hyphomicrobiaceae bacterium]